MKRLRARSRIPKPPKVASQPHGRQNAPGPPEKVESLQRALGNAGFASLLITGAPNHRLSLPPSLPLKAGAAPSPSVLRAPTAVSGAGPAAPTPRAEELIAARYPHLVGLLDARQLKVVQSFIDWRLNRERVDEQVKSFKSSHEVIEGEGGQHLGSTRDIEELAGIRAKRIPRPENLTVEVDTSKLVDRAILDRQEWNWAAEQDFRERWVLKLASIPTRLELEPSVDYPIDQVFRQLTWRGDPLFSTAGGLITWTTLMKIDEARKDYEDNVRNGPFMQYVRAAFNHMTFAWNNFEDDYNFERKRKDEAAFFVPPVAEFFGSKIDWEAAKKFLPPGKSLDNPFEMIEFLDTLTPDQLERVKRVLPSEDEFEELKRSKQALAAEYTAGHWENAIFVMEGGLTDGIEVAWRQVLGYHNRTVEGAATAVTAIRVACQLALTVAGGVVGGRLLGGAFKFAGPAIGAGAGAGVATAGLEYVSGNHDPGSILKQAGRDAIVTFITTYIGGVWADKFKLSLTEYMAETMPGAEGAWIARRAAEIGSGSLAAPIGMVVDRMLGGDFPKSAEDLVKRVAFAAATQAAMGQMMESIFGIPAPEPEGGPPKQLPGGAGSDPAAAGKAAIDTVHNDLLFPGLQEGEIGAPQSLGTGYTKPAPAMSETAEILEIDRTEPLSSGGDRGRLARQHPGFGAFPARVRTGTGPRAYETDAVVKIWPNVPKEVDLFNREMAGAKAAAATGIGPPFYGEVSVPDGVGFAMRRTPGNFIGADPSAQAGSPAAAEAARAEADVTQQAVEDVKNYGEALLHFGYYDAGDLQGFVARDGRWRPVDFGTLRPLPIDPVDRLQAIESHRRTIEGEAERLEEVLAERSLAGSAGGVGPGASGVP